MQNGCPGPLSGIVAAIGGGDGNLFTLGKVPSTLQANDSAIVDISYMPLTQQTRSVASVTFSGSEDQSFILYLFGEPTPALALAPDTISFGCVEPGSTAIGCTTVKNETSSSLSITGPPKDPSGFFALSDTDDSLPPNPVSLPITIGPGSAARVCFNFAPALAQGYSSDVTLETDDSSGVIPALGLSGMGGGPTISCLPGSLDFGAIVRGTTATLPVVCTDHDIDCSGPNLLD